MKKRFLVTALTIALIVVCAFGLFACAQKADNGNNSTPDGSQLHNWNSGVITKVATCTETGIKTYTCTDCGETKTETIPTAAHIWSNWIPYNSETHLHTCSVCHTNETQAHNLQNNVCACGYTDIAITALYLNKSTASVYIGDSITLTVTVVPTAAQYQTLNWASTNPNIATVSNGTIMGVSDGSTQIIVSSNNGVSASCTVTVAEDTHGFTFTALGGGYAVTHYDGQDTIVTVPSSYKGKPVTAIGTGYNGFYGCSSVQKVILPETVNVIDLYAFYNCIALTEIKIPNSVGSIGNFAFQNCTSLSEIEIPESVGSIATYAFMDCSALKKVTVPNTLTSSNFNFVFYNCGNIEDVTAPINVFSSITKTNLKTVNITDGTSVFDNAFKNCEKLTSVEMSDSITSIGSSAFKNCVSLTEISLSNNVTTIGESAFYGCESLTNIEIPDNITVIESNTFYGCNSLTSIEVPNGVETISSFAFYGCNSLESITLPFVGAHKKSTNDGVTIKVFGYIFGYTTSSKDATVEGATFQTGIAYTNGSVTKYWYYIPSSLNTVIITGNIETIPQQAFTNCKHIETISLPDGITKIDMEAFLGCSNLTSIEIPSSVTSFGINVFFSCTANINWGDNPTIAKLTNNTFYGYRGENLMIPDSVTYIEKGALNNCRVVNLSLPFIGGAYFGYIFGASEYSDNSYYVPSSLKTVIIRSGASIGDYAFHDCSSLTSITILNGVTSIGNWAFRGCSSLTSIEIPNSVTSIGNWAFEDCSSLTSITIPNSVTSIGDGAFSYCSSLTSIEIPNSVTRIEHSTFWDCSSLMSMVISNSVTVIGEATFGNCNSLETIYYIGTQSEFDEMFVDYRSNTSFTEAMVYFYSQDPPTDDGYYWHYDTDGKTPVVWVKEN